MLFNEDIHEAGESVEKLPDRNIEDGLVFWNRGHMTSVIQTYLVVFALAQGRSYEGRSSPMAVNSWGDLITMRSRPSSSTPLLSHSFSVRLTV